MLILPRSCGRLPTDSVWLRGCVGHCMQPDATNQQHSKQQYEYSSKAKEQTHHSCTCFHGASDREQSCYQRDATHRRPIYIPRPTYAYCRQPYVPVSACVLYLCMNTAAHALFGCFICDKRQANKQPNGKIVVGGWFHVLILKKTLAQHNRTHPTSKPPTKLLQ